QSYPSRSEPRARLWSTQTVAGRFHEISAPSPPRLQTRPARPPRHETRLPGPAHDVLGDGHCVAVLVHDLDIGKAAAAWRARISSASGAAGHKLCESVVHSSGRRECD